MAVADQECLASEDMEHRARPPARPAGQRATKPPEVVAEVENHRRFTAVDDSLSAGRNLSHAPSIPFHMPNDPEILGRCPDCGESISRVWVLVEYETDNGDTGIWAECPVCDDVVAPE